MPNSKKHGIGYFMPIWLLLFLFFISCKKSEVRDEDFVKPIEEEEALLTSAESFFKKDVLGVSISSVGGSWEKRKKTALWGNAYIAKYPQRDIVVVPLEFEKGASIGSGILGIKKLSLAEQSKLILYKDRKGKFQAEVYTFIPQKEYEANPKGKFDGLVVIDDWAGNNKGNYIFKAGKYKKLKAKSALPGNIENTNIIADVPGDGGGDGISCYFLNFYLCDVDASGAYSNCEYTGSVPLGCFDENGVETDWVDPGSNGGSGGGGEVTYYPSNEYAVTKEENWEVYKENMSGPAISVRAKVQFWGKKVATEMQGGHFTQSNDHGSYTLEFSTYGMNWSAYSQSWHGTQSAYQLVQGNIDYGTIGSDPRYVNKTKDFMFQTVFP
jgi:hypothetical protein